MKRFKIETTTLHNKFFFIKEGKGNKLEMVTTDTEPMLAVQQGRGSQIRRGKLKITKIAEIKGWKAVGERLPIDSIKSVQMEWVQSKNENQQRELFE